MSKDLIFSKKRPFERSSALHICWWVLISAHIGETCDTCVCMCAFPTDKHFAIFVCAHAGVYPAVRFALIHRLRLQNLGGYHKGRASEGPYLTHARTLASLCLFAENMQFFKSDQII